MRSRTRSRAFAAPRNCWRARVSDEDRALTQLICEETDRIVKLVDRMQSFSDERPVAAREPQHPRRARPRQTAGAGGFRPPHPLRRDLRSLAAACASASRDQLIQVFLNLMKNAAEAIGEDSIDGEIMLSTAYRPGVRLNARRRRAGQPAAGNLHARQWPGHRARDRRQSVRSVRDDQSLGLWPGTCTGRQGDRRPRRDRRVRIASAQDDVSRADAGRRSAALQRRDVSAGRARRPAELMSMPSGHISSPTTTRRSAPFSIRRCRAPATRCAPPARSPACGAGWRRARAISSITDVVMPDDNAFELLPRIKRMRPDLPIIVMSAQNTFMTAIKASERGAYEYLPKPFDLKELVAIVGRALAEPKRAARRAEDAGPSRQHAAGRPLAGDAGHFPLARPADADRSHGDDLRRIRHRQGARRARAARLRQAQERPVRRHQHGGDPARPHRERVVRPREGRLHRRQRALGRPLRAGRGRHAVSRRNRRHADGGADPASARAAAGRIHDGRRPHADQDQRAHRRGDQQGLALRHPAGPVPRGSVLPPQRRAAAAAAFARAHRGHPRSRARISSSATSPRGCRPNRSSRRRSSGCGAIPGPATSANSKI